jgi:hypothetical protein
MRFTTALVLACTTFALSPVANAAQWYVAPGGHGDGTSAASAFDTIQKGLDAAQPGDAVIVAAGTYDESIQTVRDGTDSAAITLTAETGANVVITSSGRVLRVDHAYFSVSEVVFDGQYGESDVLDINDGATGFVLSRSEVRHSGRDCVDMGAPLRSAIQVLSPSRVRWIATRDRTSMLCFVAHGESTGFGGWDRRFLLWGYPSRRRGVLG